MVITTGNILLIGSILLFVSIVAGKAGYKFGMPVLLLFLAVGMLFGSDGLGIQFQNPAATQFVGMIALSIILFSGGMDTRYEEIRPVWREGVVLATLGVLMTALITGLFIYLIAGLFNYNLTVVESLLLASVMSSTDSASVFSILRSKKQDLKQKLRPLLELESGSNDPMAYMLTILLIEVITSGGTSYGHATLMFFVQLAVGALMGYLLGKLAVIVINRINIGNHSLYSVFLLSTVFFIFSFTDLVKGNGYLAVYIAGLVVGNSKMILKKSLMTFFDGFTWLFQIVMFLSLGLLVNPGDLVHVAGFGMLIGVFMIVLARPVTVMACLLPFRGLTFKARLYVSWVGLRGAVPIIFATYPLIAGIGNAMLIFNVVFFITIVSLLVQGTSVSWMARILGLSTDKPEEGFDISLPDNIKSAMSEIEVIPAVLAGGDHLKEIRLPSNTLVVMVRRGDRFFVPRGNTQLLLGDKLLVISDNDAELQHIYDELGIKSPIIKN